MKRILLLPFGFKRVGWILLAVAAVIGVFGVVIDFDYGSISQLAWLKGAAEPLMNNSIILGFWLGAIGVCCSREKIEDEMVERIRLNALLITLYVYAALIIVATLCINGIEFLDIMIYNLVAQPILYVIIYRIMLWRWNKTLSDEE